MALRYRLGRSAAPAYPRNGADSRCRVIGLLGGSFNPAHRGHDLISRQAISRLALDEVWWLVSPQNPLKSRADMAPLSERLKSAQEAAKHPRIRPMTLESRLGTQFTADTLSVLQRRAPKCRFVWLMGADCLAQVDQWQQWQQLFHIVAVAVFDRPTYSFKALAAKAAVRFKHRRVAMRRSRRLAQQEPPAWVFLHTRRDPMSATAIRRHCVSVQSIK